MSFFFALLFMILVFWRPQEWLVPALFGVPLLNFVTGLSGVSFMVEYSAKRVSIPRDTPFFLLVLGLLAGAVMSHLSHLYFAAVIWTVEEVWKMCFFMALLFCVTDRPSRLKKIAWMFVVMACVMSIHALMQQKYGYGFTYQPVLVSGRPGLDEPVSRSTFFGIFEDPNDLAQILGTAIPFAFALTRRGGLFSIVSGIGFSAYIVQAIAATHSRGGQIAMVGVVAVMVMLLLPSRWLMVMLFIGAMGGLVLCPFAGGSLDESARERVAFWGDANWAFKNNVLFGVGFKMIGDYITGGRAAHNSFVLCYTELGLFGYWFWITTIVTGIVGAWRSRMALERSGSVDGRYVARFAGLAIAAMVGFLASAYFLSRAYVYPLFFLMVTLGAVPVIARRYLPDDHKPLVCSWRETFVYGTSTTLISIVYVYISIILINKLGR